MGYCKPGAWPSAKLRWVSCSTLGDFFWGVRCCVHPASQSPAQGRLLYCLFLPNTLPAMPTITMLQAKAHLAHLIESIEQGAAQEILIVRDGRPVAKLVALAATPIERRLGIAKGLFEVPEDIDADNAEVARLFYGGAT
jgi:antitoxin (DNA-binding transcriptional repressor) of toxin-antitoxin stability system